VSSRNTIKEFPCRGSCLHETQLRTILRRVSVRQVCAGQNPPLLQQGASAKCTRASKNNKEILIVLLDSGESHGNAAKPLVETRFGNFKCWVRLGAELAVLDIADYPIMLILSSCKSWFRHYNKKSDSLLKPSPDINDLILFNCTILLCSLRLFTQLLNGNPYCKCNTYCQKL